MRQLRPSSEAEMIAEFLRQEYASHDRYGARIDECLEEEGVPPDRIRKANINDSTANDDRRRVFARYRGYGTGRSSYLTGFPATGVDWAWVALSPGELLESKYNGYPGSEWMNLSQDTRDPRMAAARITTGQVASPLVQTLIDLADQLRNGLTVPPLILVSADAGQTRVILEGHTRITAWALAPESIPGEVHIILGTSPAIANWDEY